MRWIAYHSMTLSVMCVTNISHVLPEHARPLIQTADAMKPMSHAIAVRPSSASNSQYASCFSGRSIATTDVQANGRKLQHAQKIRYLSTHGIAKWSWYVDCHHVKTIKIN